MTEGGTTLRVALFTDDFSNGKTLTGRILDRRVGDVHLIERTDPMEIDICYPMFSTGQTNVVLLAAPVSRNFMAETIRALAPVDVALLVVSAKRGEFEDEWPRDHVALLRDKGVKKFIFFIDKIDDKDVKWDHRRFSEITRAIGDVVRAHGTAHPCMAFVPGSIATGRGIVCTNFRCTKCAPERTLFYVFDRIARMLYEE